VELLFKLGCIGRAEDGTLHPTGAGILLFGYEYEIVKEFPCYFLDYQEHEDESTRWTDRIISSSSEWSGNIYDFYYRVYNRIAQEVKTPFKLVGDARVDDTPVHKALREALANCLIHANHYGRRGIVIHRHPSKITIANPGGMRVSIEDAVLAGVSDPRNQTLIKLFNLMEIGERSGSGLSGIFAVWKDMKWPEPVLEEQFNPDRTILSLVLRKTSDKKPSDKIDSSSPQQLSELARRGKNIPFDSQPTDYKKADQSFTVFEAAIKKETKTVMTSKAYESFGMCLPDGTLTYAGLLFADDCPLRQARVFCIHWDGLSKGSLRDAIDSEEFDGDIISLLSNSRNFVRLNSKVRWEKTPDRRINKPDYADRAVLEALVNALMHREWSVIGSEVHVDMYDDRLDIYSPGGMFDGSLIQETDIEFVPSIRRNPAVADVFGRLSFAERQGSGLKRIRDETSLLHGYTDEYAPKFVSSATAFHTILRNMNYREPPTSRSRIGVGNVGNNVGDGIKTLDGIDKIIVEMIGGNKSTSISQLAEAAKRSTRTIDRRLTALQARGMLRRVSSVRGGHWEIVE
jgi:predicted HTH transcriptional regulator